jgi:curved DNA-binding protein CbpA
MENYYAILGLSPGAGITEVQKAFRERIKLCHPDIATGPQSAETARQLIEAYNFLKDTESAKNNVHVEYTATGSAVYRAAGGTTSFYTTHTETGPESFRSGEDFFKDIFGKKASEYINKFRRGSSHSPYQSFAQTAGYSVNNQKPKPAGTATAQPDIFEGASETAKKAYMIAEGMLRDVVSKYNRQHDRPRRQWARDYARDLNAVQMRFRTVATQNPSIYRGAMTRLRQIQDLDLEIRKYLK